ncbi:hypothetical protein ScPMuIL_007052 [Solemya velum]
MSLYPTLEDMKVDQLAQAQRQYEQPPQPSHQPLQYPPQDPAVASAPPGSTLYPSLGDYMGLQLTPELIAQNTSVVPVNPGQSQVGVRQNAAGQMQVAPISAGNKGIVRAEVKQGIREVIACKDQDGKIGLRIRHVNNGLFVALVQQNKPAALAGLRFGDQILQIDGQNVAGWDNNKAHRVLKEADPNRIVFAVRDRPFERTITMQKDSAGYVGFVFKDGRIKSIVKDSSAARNGLLTDHQLIEVDGQNVVGVKDKEVGDIIDAGARTLTVTVMPSFLYDHIVKCMGNSIVKKLMDHSIPDL